MNLTMQNVRSVYSGRAHKCCCGCAGKHSYNAQFVAEASKERGYQVMADEVNDKQVRRVTTLLMHQHSMFPLDDADTDCVWTDVGNRTYIAYLRG